MSKNKFFLWYYLLLITALFAAILIGCGDEDAGPPVGPDIEFIRGTVSAFVFDSLFNHGWDSSIAPMGTWPRRGAEVVCLYSHPLTGVMQTITGSTNTDGLFEFSLELKDQNDSATIFARHYQWVSHVNFIRFDHDEQFLEVPIYMNKFIVAECTAVNIISERVPVNPSAN